jgi:hypothetical protein
MRKPWWSMSWGEMSICRNLSAALGEPSGPGVGSASVNQHTPSGDVSQKGAASSWLAISLARSAIFELHSSPILPDQG